MSDSKWCDGHKGRIRSHIGRVDIDGTYQFCVPCHQKIREEGLKPGEDFEIGELWSRGDGDDE